MPIRLTQVGIQDIINPSLGHTIGMGYVMRNFIINFLEYIVNPDNLSVTLPVIVLLILTFMRIPQKIIRWIVNMAFSIVIEYRSKEISERFLRWIVNESKKYSSDELLIIRSDLEKVYRRKWTSYVFPETVNGIRDRVFEKLHKRLRMVGEGEYIFSKFENSDLFCSGG